MKTFTNRSPRLAIGVAAIALTLATLAVAVHAPADMIFHSEQIGVLQVAESADAVAVAPGTLVTEINVVATRAARPTVVATRRSNAKGA